MENLLLLLAGSIVLRLSSSPKSKLQFIGETGCSVLVHGDKHFDQCKTPSGDTLHVHECSEGKVGYGVICIALQENYDPSHAVNMLAAYMKRLKGPFSIFHSTGLVPGTDWNAPGSESLVDYWQDAEGRDWKVKGYTNGRCLAVLYVRNIGQLSTERQEQFLDSFHFGPAR
ncbi:MAG TPA: hypothetical protein VFR58_02585 [Flavisolibacter sp.]|nr:hypothetical protein [Flavisolibacter sp.]